MPGERRPPSAAGVYAALATPRRPNSVEADSAALLDYLDAVVGAEVDGLVLFGSTGEFVHFEIEERMRTAALAIKRSRVPVLVNVSHSALPGAVALAENAIEAGASGLLLMPPYFFRCSSGQILEFYSQFCRSLGDKLPVYLYNLPSSTAPLSAALCRRLLETGSFAGIKDSSGDLELLNSLAELHRSLPFQLLVGSERVYVEARRAGADGIISGIAAAVPELVVALERAIVAGNAERVAYFDRKLGEFLAFVEHFPPTVAIRQAAAVRGWKLGPVAVPLDEDAAAEVIGFHRQFRDWLAEILPECSQTPAVRT